MSELLRFRIIMNKLFKVIFTASFIILLSSCAHHTPSSSPSKSTTILPYVSPPSTTNKVAMRIYEILPVYSQAAKMPWQPIQIKTLLKKGQHNDVVPVIRERLIAFQDLPPEVVSSKNTLFDITLAHGIARFQSENGLPVTGVINQDTLNALNITPTTRFYALLDSMNQWAKYPEDASSRYIQVNIPSYTMRLIQNGHDALTMRVIVGRPSRPTPTLRSNITTIVFNPSWNVPETILVKDVIPGMQKNTNYLHEHYDMKVYANWDKNAPEVSVDAINWHAATASNFTYRVTAPPSDKNPLGRVKFIFANEHDIYMHDTPEKSLFVLNDRARSSGCIRLEKPMELVQYFDSENSDLTPALVNHYLSTYETKYVQLKYPMPVYITYILNWADPEGHAHFAKDVYH